MDKIQKFFSNKDDEFFKKSSQNLISTILMLN